MDLKTYCSTVESQTSLAKRLGVSQGFIWQVLNGRSRITAERAIAIEKVTEGKVSKHTLRPDIFGPVPVETLPEDADAQA